MTKQTVLFLCTGNSARSQMAEALLRHKAGERFTVYSAGTHPEQVDSRAIAALHKRGINSDNLTAKGTDAFANQAFDYVITLCDKAGNECRSYPNAKKQLAWDFPDPKARSGSDPFSVTLTELENRISMFLIVEQAQPVTAPAAEFIVTEFYKSLTDDIRLKTLMLTHYHGELCVCELMQALGEQSQPKVSRNLAVLKKNHILTTRKTGQWVFYRINPELPLWAKAVIAQTTENNIALIAQELQRLNAMQNRPEKINVCN